MSAFFRRAFSRGPDCQDLNEQGNNYMSANRLTEARSSYEQALVLARGSGDQECEMQVQGNLGNCCWREKEYEEAAEHYERALDIAHFKGGRDTEAMNLGRLASTHLVLNNLEQALDYCQRALKLAEDMRNVDRKASMLGTLAMIYSRSGSSYEEQALATFQEALKQARVSSDRQVEASIKENYARFLQRTGRNSEQAQAEGEGEAAGYTLQSNVSARTIMERGDQYLSQGETSKALSCYREAGNAYKRELLLKREDPLALGKLMSDLGVVAAKLGNYDDAYKCFDSALTIARTTYDRDTCSLIDWNHGLLSCEQGNVKYGLEKMYIRIIFETDFDLPTLKARRALMSELRKKA